MKTKAEKPKLKLSGQDGNAFFILGRAEQTLRRAGYTEDEVKQFRDEATAGDYDHLLGTCMRWFDWS